MNFKGLLHQGAQNMLPPGLLGDMDPQTQKYLTNRVAMGGMADLATAFGQGLDKYYGVPSSGGPTSYAQQSLDQIPGLLEQQQAQKRLAANQQALGQYAQQGEIPAHLQALLANNPELMEHFFKERYTGRTITPGGVFKMQGQPDYQAPNRPQTVGTDLVDPNDGRLIHRAPPNAGVNINVGTGATEFGTVPSGEEMRRLPDGTVVQRPVTGSAPWREMVTDLQKRTATVDALSELGTLASGLLQHSGFESGVGPGANFRRLIPGSAARDYQAAEARVLAKTFLQAFEALKGGGPITDVEGQTATRALATLDDPTISPEEYRAAVQQLLLSIGRIQQEQRYYIETFGKVIDYAPQEPAAPAAPAAAPQVRHWNPQTGRLE